MLHLLADKSFDRRRKIKALILTPTRELAAQIHENVKEYSKYTSIKSTVIFGGVNQNPQVKVLKDGVDILIATPGRLLDLKSQNVLSLSNIEFLVLDEADRMLDMGFIHDIKKVIKFIPKQRQTLLFSATFSKEIKALAQEFLKSPVQVEAAPENTAAETVKQVIHPVNRTDKAKVIVKLVKDGDWSQVLVFTRTKHKANRIADKLNKSGIESAAIHGDKSQGARTKALAGFKQGVIRVLVATDIAARGIDVSDVTHVINFDAPVMYTDYVHRVGRTGRAKNEGVAITVVSEVEQYHIAKIEELIRQKIKVLKLPEKLEVLDSSYEEKQAFAREIDRQKRKEDPDYKGAFHEKKKAKKNQPNKANRKTIQAYKFITEEAKKKRKKSGKNTKRRK